MFILLHEMDGSPLLVNLDYVRSMLRGPKGEINLFYDHGIDHETGACNEGEWFQESFEEVIRALVRAGIGVAAVPK